MATDLPEDVLLTLISGFLNELHIMWHANPRPPLEFVSSRLGIDLQFFSGTREDIIKHVLLGMPYDRDHAVCRGTLVDQPIIQVNKRLSPEWQGILFLHEVGELIVKTLRLHRLVRRDYTEVLANRIAGELQYPMHRLAAMMIVRPLDAFLHVANASDSGFCSQGAFVDLLPPFSDLIQYMPKVDSILCALVDTQNRP